MEKKRISNLDRYIEKKYPGAFLIERAELEVPDFLQRDFESGSNNCSIASIVRIINYYFKDINKEEVYKDVMKIARRTGYFDGIGTIPMFIAHIANTYFKKKGINGKSRGIYLGNFYSHIKDEINNLRPVMMNLGYGFYKNHSLVVFGYSIYYYKRMKIKILHVYDGWHRSKSYIDYNELNGFANLPIYSYNIFNIENWRWRKWINPI